VATLVVFPFVLIFIFIGFFPALAIWFVGTPHWIYSIIRCERFGPHLTFWQVCIFILIAILSLPIYFGFGLVCTVFGTYRIMWDEASNDAFGRGLPEVWREAFYQGEQWRDRLWKFSTRDARQNLTAALQPGEVVKDIFFTDVVVAIILLLFGYVVFYPWWLMMIVYKFIPGTLVLYTWLYERYKDWYDQPDSRVSCCLCFPGFIIAHVGIFLFAVGVALFMIFQGILIIAFTGLVYLDVETIRDSAVFQLACLQRTDWRTQRIIQEKVCCRNDLQQDGYPSLITACLPERYDTEMHLTNFVSDVTPW